MLVKLPIWHLLKEIRRFGNSNRPVETLYNRYRYAIIHVLKHDNMQVDIADIRLTSSLVDCKLRYMNLVQKLKIFSGGLCNEIAAQKTK